MTRKGEAVEPALLLAEYAAWLRIEKGRSAKTVDAYQRDLARFFTFVEQHDLMIPQVTSAFIEQYFAQLRANGLAAASIARHRSSLAGFYHFLVDESHLGEDPTVTLAPVRIPSRLPKALSETVITDLIDAVSGTDPLSRRDRAILELLYATGARASEVCRLDISDLNYDEGLLRLLGKGDKERLVPIGRSAQSALANWLDHGGRDTLIENSRRSGDSQAVFINTRGKRLSRQALHHLIVERGKLAGVPEGLSPHSFRHSCATHMLANGADIRVVQELLGHASVSTTQIYTKVTVEQIRGVYNAAHPRARSTR